ncbi:MAG: GxxExxY protein [Bacteroidota bacterium]
MPATKEELNKLTYKIIGSAIDVHKNLGPGLLESVYHKCLAHEFTIAGISYSSELIVPINYKGLEVSADLRCDFVVENLIVLELKAVEAMAAIFETKLMTYMRLLQKPKGILINFNSTNLFKEGQWTYVNEYFRNLPPK